MLTLGINLPLDANYCGIFYCLLTVISELAHYMYNFRHLQYCAEVLSHPFIIFCFQLVFEASVQSSDLTIFREMLSFFC